MNTTVRSSAALSLLLASGALVAAAPIKVPPYIAAAVADPSRPEADRARDVNRKPAEVIAFAGIKPGDQIAELMPGGGYFTRIFCLIAGPKGHVYTVHVTPAVPRPPPAAGSAAPPPPPPNPCTNLSDQSQSAADLSLPASLDVVWTSENYHDLHNAAYGPPDMKAFDSVIFKALKPGGVFMVEDHAAEPGSGGRDTGTLHRIDVELVKQEVTSAGFVFEAASDVLHNAEDPHQAKVFELKGTSDKFLLKFRKPRH
ncbi:MAG: methyltransferase [Steroidobacteraceae bacterium]